MNRAEALDFGVAKLTEAGFSEAHSDAMILLEYTLNITRNDMYVHPETDLSGDEVSAYSGAIDMRLKHIPVQHITGFQDFMGLEFAVNEHVLIPRQDTETLVEEVMRFNHDGNRILDMCTGSGCILLSLLKYSNDCIGVGVDISDEALDVAKTNADRLGLKADFVHSNLFTELLDDKFDIIVSNPPYIESDVIETLMEEVRDHEPRLALDGSADGLEFYKRIVSEAPSFLRKGGMLFFEIGYNQGQSVSDLLKAAQFSDVTVVKDLAGCDRVVYGLI